MKILVNKIFKLFLVFVPFKKLRAKLKADWTKWHIKKYVLSAKNIKAEKKAPEEPIIFQYWQQGFDKLPAMVRRCIDSVAFFEPDTKRVLLDFKNIENYVELPGRIYDLKNKNKITPAQFSDILRSALLAFYPCCWIDSTILLTNPVANYVKNTDFFMFKGLIKTPENFAGANYFIWSKAPNDFTLQLKQAMFDYWSKNDFLISYFIHPHFISLIANQNPEIWNKIPVYDERLTLQLAPILFTKFDEKIWNDIKKKSFIHKLTYKIPKKAVYQGSFFEEILKEKP